MKKEMQTQKKRLSPEQQAEIFALLVNQKQLRHKIIAPYSMVLSSVGTPLLMTAILFADNKYSNFLKEIFLSLLAEVSIQDSVMLKAFYAQGKLGWKRALSEFDSYLAGVVDNKEVHSVEEFIIKYDLYPFDQLGSLSGVKKYFVNTLIYFLCANHNNYKLLECNGNTDAVNRYMLKSLRELYSLILNAYRNLDGEVARYVGVEDVIPTDSSDTFRKLRLFLLISYSALTIAMKDLVFEPLLVKLSFYRYLPFKQDSSQTLYFSEAESRDLIQTLINQNKRLAGKATVSFYLNAIFFLVCASIVYDSFVYRKERSMMFSLAMVSYFFIMLKSVLKEGYLYYENSRLNSKLLESKNILNQISRVSHQLDWSICKDTSIFSSYFALDFQRNGRLSAKHICEVVKYAILIDDIDIISDAHSTIIIPGNVMLNQSKIERVKKCIVESLEHLSKLRLLKKQYYNLPEFNNDNFSYHVKRDKNRSLTSVYKKDISQYSPDIVELGKLQKIFPKHKVKIKEGKMSIKGFAPLDDHSVTEFRELFFQKKSKQLEKIMPPKDLLPSEDGAVVRLRHLPNKPAPTSNVPTVISAKEKSVQKICWEKVATYDSSDPNCQVYKSQSSGKTSLFVFSMLKQEHFPDEESYKHYLAKIRDAKAVGKKGEQGLVRVPDICARDINGQRFFAKWKYKFLGTLGDLRPLCEEFRAKTGERLLVVKAISDHKSIHKMMKS